MERAICTSALRTRGKRRYQTLRTLAVAILFQYPDPVFPPILPRGSTTEASCRSGLSHFHISRLYIYTHPILTFGYNIYTSTSRTDPAPAFGNNVIQGYEGTNSDRIIGRLTPTGARDTYSVSTEQPKKSIQSKLRL